MQIFDSIVHMHDLVKSRKTFETHKSWPIFRFFSLAKDKTETEYPLMQKLLINIVIKSTGP